MRRKDVAMSRKYPLVTFSGLDGAGKSTQIELLVSHLKAVGQRSEVIWTRGGYTPSFEALKRVLRTISRGTVVPPSGHSPRRDRALGKPCVRRLWLILALLDLLWVYGVQVRWLRWRKRIVICDRYIWDTLTDFRLNFPQERIEGWLLWRLLVKLSPRPDTAFLFLIPVEEAVHRSRQKQEPFPDSPEILASRLAQYQALAKNGGWRIMDGRRPIAELAAEIGVAVSQAG